jgi:hypothetical protein
LGYLARPVSPQKHSAKQLSPSIGPRLLEAYRAALIELAKERGAVLVPSAGAADDRLDPGLDLLRELAAAETTIHPRGNPYLRLVTELPGTLAGPFASSPPEQDGARLLRAMRPALVTTYSYAVPTEAVLDRLAAGRSIVEIGAGGGYWARCLHDRGATVSAFDRVLPVEQVRPGGRIIQHHPVGIATPAEALAAARGARTLLLCWPPGLINRDEAAAGAAPVFSPMGNEALDRFDGDQLVFVGDRIASFGSPRFFARLDDEWTLVERMPLPNLGTWRDSAAFYRR